MYWQTNDMYKLRQNCCVGQCSAILYTQNMHVEWKIVTNNPQVTKKLKEFAKMCYPCNTTLKLVLWNSMMAVTLFVLVLFTKSNVVLILFLFLFYSIFQK